MDIKVPHLAEGISSGTVVSILVKEGEEVKKDQTVLELETEKAVAPIPASEGGKVSKILVKEGDKVAVGQAVMTLANGSAAPAAAAKAPAAAAPSAAAPRPAQPAVPAAPQPPAAAGDYSYQSKSGFPPPASPVIRKMARDLGIDLARVRGTERGGRITLDDLRAYIGMLQQGCGAAPAAPAGQAKPASAPVDFSKWGPVTRKPLTSLRQKIAEKMTESWTTIPHVTQFEEADITSLMEKRKQHKAAFEKAGAQLTLTVLLLKAVVAVLKKYPGFNSSLDESKQELVLKQYYHIGVAVDTEQGLIVPVVKDTDKKSLLEVSKDLAALAEKTRQRKIGVEDLQGGTFTISNLGSIGGQHFTPIVNKPQVAILGVGRGVQKPVIAKNGKVENRLMLPLALSYDHRVVDGADGARFIQSLVQEIENFSEDLFKVSGSAKAAVPAAKKPAKGKK